MHSPADLSVGLAQGSDIIRMVGFSVAGTMEAHRASRVSRAHTTIHVNPRSSSGHYPPIFRRYLPVS